MECVSISAASDQVSCADSLPLVVDLDGLLARNDPRLESYLQLLASDPLAALGLLPSLLARPNVFARRLADSAPLHLSSLPYDRQLLDVLERERASGRRLYLVTRAHQRQAKAIADHLGVFEDVFATCEGRPLTDRVRSEVLVSRFGEQGFVYLGRGSESASVRGKAAQFIAWPSSASLEGGEGLSTAIPNRPGRWPGFKAYMKAIRPHQWSKNVLIGVAMLAAHAVNWPNVLLVLGAFIAFGLVASSAYVLNDLLDLSHDRVHPHKCRRAFASGAIPIAHGLFLSPALLLAGVALGAVVSLQLLAVLLCYFVTTLLYSFWIKRRPLIDVMTLGLLFTLRVYAGAVAIDVAISPWLLLFSLFLFFSLAVVKRYSELVDRLNRNEDTSGGRGYQVDDLQILAPMSLASGYGAVLVMGLYVNSEDVNRLYTHPDWLWWLCPLLLFWVSRMAMISHRGAMHYDPVVFAVTDRVSLGVGLAALAVLVAAI